MEKVLISVVVPIYKVESYLERCINSIVNQTYKNLEIILVDDGSPDNCPAICDEWAKKDSRIKVIHKENGGLMAAWIDGLECATGDYVYFIDSDDWIEEFSIKDYVDVIIQYKPDAIINDYYISSENVKNKKQALVYDKIGYIVGDDFIEFKSKYLSNSINFTYYRWNKIFKRKILLDNVQFCDTSISVFEDINIIFATMLDIKNLYIMQKPGYNYFVRENSMIRVNFKTKDIQNNDNVLKCLINIAKFKKVNVKQLICNLIYFMAIWLSDGIVRSRANKKENYELLNKSFLLNNEYVKEIPKYIGNIKGKVFNCLKTRKYTLLKILRFAAVLKHKVLGR